MPVNFRLEWTLPFASGELKTEGDDDNGHEILTDVSRTSSEPTLIRLRPMLLNEPAEIDDVLEVAAEILDANGDVCTLAGATKTYR